jgi:hypothetical protein
MYLARAAEIVRKEMSQHKTRFTGTFDEVSMTETVPNSLLALVSMIEHGLDIKSQIENGITDADIAIAQLLLYNFHSKQAKDTGSHQRHPSDLEPPFAIYVGLLLFPKTRKRNLIDLLFQHGICISYDRVLEISTTLGDTVIQKYLEDGVVCPSVLQVPAPLYNNSNII